MPALSWKLISVLLYLYKHTTGEDSLKMKILLILFGLSSSGLYETSIYRTFVMNFSVCNQRRETIPNEVFIDIFLCDKVTVISKSKNKWGKLKLTIWSPTIKRPCSVLCLRWLITRPQKCAHLKMLNSSVNQMKWPWTTASQSSLDDFRAISM